VQNIGKADPNNATLTTCCAQPGDFSDGGREDAVDGLGQLWVADMPNFRTQVWSVTGTKNKFLFAAPSSTSPQLPAAGAFSYPEGVGVAGDGTIVVSDSHNFRLEFFDSATSSTPYALDTAGGSAQNPGQEGLRGRQNNYSLNYARNLVFNTNASSPTYGDFYLADTYNNSVHGFAENGTPLWTYGGNGTGGVDGPNQPAISKIANTSVKSPLALPSGVAVDDSTGPNAGDIYIADSGDKRVVVISPAGTLLSLFSISQFKDPRGLAVDPTNGNLYVGDFSGAAVYKFTISGVWGSTTNPGVATMQASVSTSASAGKGSSPFDIVVDPANSAIYVSDTSLQEILSFGTTSATSLPYLGDFAITGQPEGLSLSPTGDLYIASRSNDKILVYCNPISGVC
jgi:DNA-binding beta-propeller fold protein YncE